MRLIFSYIANSFLLTWASPFIYTGALLITCFWYGVPFVNERTFSFSNGTFYGYPGTRACRKVIWKLITSWIGSRLDFLCSPRSSWPSKSFKSSFKRITWSKERTWSTFRWQFKHSTVLFWLYFTWSPQSEYSVAWEIQPHFSLGQQRY